MFRIKECVFSTFPKNLVFESFIFMEHFQQIFLNGQLVQKILIKIYWLPPTPHPPPLSFDPTSMKKAWCAESNEKSIFRFLFLVIISSKIDSFRTKMTISRKKEKSEKSERKIKFQIFPIFIYRVMVIFWSYCDVITPIFDEFFTITRKI